MSPDDRCNQCISHDPLFTPHVCCREMVMKLTLVGKMPFRFKISGRVHWHSVNSLSRKRHGHTAYSEPYLNRHFDAL